jgi:hypothetical protein
MNRNETVQTGSLAMRHICVSGRLPSAPVECLHALAAAEARAVWELYGAGRIAEAHFDPAGPDGPTGIVTIDADSRDDMVALLADLPLVAEELITFDIYAIGPFRQLALAFAPHA